MDEKFESKHGGVILSTKTKIEGTKSMIACSVSPFFSFLNHILDAGYNHILLGGINICNAGVDSSDPLPPEW